MRQNAVVCQSSTNNELYHEVSQRLAGFDRSNFMKSNEDAVNKVLNGSYAFIADYVGKT